MKDITYPTGCASCIPLIPLSAESINNTGMKINPLLSDDANIASALCPVL